MRVLIVATDEPVFLVPYLRQVIAECRSLIVGVAVHHPPPRRPGARRALALALLAALMLSPRQWLRLAAWKGRDVLAALGLTTTRHHLADVCREAGIPVRRIATVNGDDFAAYLREQQIDVLFHQTPEILRSPVLAAPRIAVLNRHMSLLPAYRGAWPIFWQLANGEREVGVSLHVVDEGIDSGAVVAQEAIARRNGETMGALLERLFARAVPLTCAAFERLRAGTPAPQPSAGGRLYRTPTVTEIMRYVLRPPGAPGAV